MPLSMIGQSAAILNSDFIALVIVKDRHIVWANEAMHRLFGYVPDELIGKSTRLFFPDQASFEAFGRAVQSALTERGIYRGTVMQKLKDGATGWFEFNISPHSDHPDLKIGAIVDQTESHRLADRLQASELRYRSVVEDQTEVICRILPDGTFVFVNEVYCRFFDKSADDLIGKRWQPIAHPDDLSLIERKLQEISPAHPVVTIENRVQTAGGGERWMQFVNRGCFDNDGQLKEIQSVGRDITDLKQAEASLLESKERYRALVEATSVVTWNCPPSGLHIAPQPSWMSFTGQTSDELLGDGWTQAVHPEDAGAALTLWTTAVERDEPFLSEHRIRRHDGEWRWMRVEAVPVRNPEGKTVEWVGMGQDITDQRQAELSLKDNKDRLELALAGSGMACWDWDIRNHKVVGDERWHSMLGYPSDELGDDEERWLALIDPRDRARFNRAMTAYLQGDSSHFLSEHRLRHHEGHWVVVEARGKVTRRDEQGSPLRMVGTVLDVTQRKRLSEEGVELLRQIESLIRTNSASLPADRTEDTALASLTKRERQVLGMIAEGMTSAQIGKQLQLATNTIVSHRKNLMAKLGLHTTVEVARFAMEHGLLPSKQLSP